MPKYHSLRGMPDILGDEAFLYNWVDQRARQVFGIFGFTEIRTPLVEETEVFTRSIGEDTDIVQKEMYTFPDRGGKSVSLRPEGTASIIRAYIEHGLSQNQDVTKLFYIGPMFRGERPQKGRLRQFHQIGAEIIGSSSPYIDAEILLNAHRLLTGINVNGFTIELNTLGCEKDRVSYRKALKGFLDTKKALLCEDCARRIDTNVLRVLDCKKGSCAGVIASSPVMPDHICGACADEYRVLKSVLKDTGVKFRENVHMVRGLDYYTKTIFEITHPALGAKDAIAAGGRYDDLTKDMGGPDVGAIGYAVGIERVFLAISREGIVMPAAGVLVVALGEDLQKEGLLVSEKLRSQGIPCELDHSGRSLKGGLRKANREKRKKVIILGEDEVKQAKVLLKDMETGEQSALTLDEAALKIKKG